MSLILTIESKQKISGAKAHANDQQARHERVTEGLQAKAGST
jgi:hypothetical protein